MASTKLTVRIGIGFLNDAPEKRQPLFIPVWYEFGRGTMLDALLGKLDWE